MGALCLIDRQPRQMSAEDLQTLRDLGALVERELNLEEARESQKQLIQAREAAEQANRTTNTFLANMSHELHTPLNAIIGYSEMLIEEATDLGEQSFGDDLGKIRAAAQRLLGMIEDVLVVARRESEHATLKVETFELDEVLSEAVVKVRPGAEAKGNEIVVERPPELPPSDGPGQAAANPASSSRQRLQVHRTRHDDGAGSLVCWWWTAGRSPAV